MPSQLEAAPMSARAALESARGASPDSTEVSVALEALAALEPHCASWVIEAMELFYLSRFTWAQVGAKLGYSAVHVRRTVHRSLDSCAATFAPPSEGRENL